ncbi:hypothetical protein [Roseisalinus antarcticus]|uniref:Uncharacterized protein n=1 Tax=Roseisalinus antarcticus TaxID=254357 RepID=A0A1Y5U108_9RHOB|nr:hypothetical protein [Roseisalinus antarcticus]SLN78007.1 hypothetical protein ROA7023_04653 [Roseisalinus antarcticus]
MIKGSENRELTAVEQVKFQGEFIEAAEQDENFVADGGKIYWAIDTNIIYFLIDPIGRAFPDDEQQTGYATIFTNDPRRAVEILAEALANYIVEDLSPNAPLFVPPSIDRQVFLLVEGLSQEGAVAADELEGNNIGAKANQLANWLANSSESDDKSDVIAAKLLNLALLRKTTSQLARLERLLESGRIVIAGISAANLPKPLPFAMEVSDSEGKGYLRQLLEEGVWRSFLGGLIPGRNKGKAFETKASALSTLHRWNDRLARLHKNAPNTAPVKINFLTGDTPLVTTRSHFLPTNVPSAHAELMNFCDTHFRHPRGLLADLPMLKFPDEDRLNNTHFFDLWSHWTLGEDAQDQAEISENIQQNWAEFLSKAVLNYDFDQRTNDLEDWQLRSITAFESWREKREDRIEEEISEFWERCFYFATQGLVRFGSASTMRPNARNAPPVYLESWSSTYNLISQIVNWNSPSEFDAEKYKSGLALIDREFKGRAESERDARYAYYIAHAVLFAARGNWSISSKVAAFAQRFARTQTSRPGEANGREAIYIQAFCLRHAARNLEDLEPLPELVKRAREIAKGEQDAAFSKGIERHDSIAIRFDAEIEAINITAWLFRRFSTNSFDLVEENETLSRLIESSKGLLEKVENCYETSKASAENDPESEKRCAVIFRLRVRMLVNLLGLSVFRRDQKFDTVLQRELFRKSEEIEIEYEKLHSSTQSHCFSAYGKMIRSSVAYLTTKDSQKKKEFQNQIVDLTSNDKRNQMATFPYDKGVQGRLSWLRAIAEVET